jgi:hypothetical protein
MGCSKIYNLHQGSDGNGGHSHGNSDDPLAWLKESVPGTINDHHVGESWCVDTTVLIKWVAQWLLSFERANPLLIMLFFKLSYTLFLLT